MTESVSVPQEVDTHDATRGLFAKVDDILNEKEQDLVATAQSIVGGLSQ